MTPIYKNLYQFTTYIPPMNFTIHQYLLRSDPAILFATGTIHDARNNLSSIKELLGKQKLAYIFVSHMESDECGGLSVFQEEYPEVQVICSALGARELPGYGYSGRIVAAGAGEKIVEGDLSLHILDYPSEVHLQNGIVAYEEHSGIFYSSDLMFALGNAGGQIHDEAWNVLVNGVDEGRIPNEEMRKQLQKNLLAISPEFVAVGHGFCVRCI